MHCNGRDDMIDHTTIKLRRVTVARLRKHAVYGDSMDSVVSRILDEVEKQ